MFQSRQSMPVLACCTLCPPLLSCSVAQAKSLVIGNLARAGKVGDVDRVGRFDLVGPDPKSEMVWRVAGCGQGNVILQFDVAIIFARNERFQRVTHLLRCPCILGSAGGLLRSWLQNGPDLCFEGNSLSGHRFLAQ